MTDQLSIGLTNLLRKVELDGALSGVRSHVAGRATIPPVGGWSAKVGRDGEQRMATARKPLYAVRQAWDDFMAFPEAVKAGFGSSLNILQRGGTPLSGYKRLGETGRPPLEQLDDDDEGNRTYRVLLVTLETGIYVLHAFIKKSRKGIATPKPEMDLAKQRRRSAVACDANLRAWTGIAPPVVRIGR